MPERLKIAAELGGTALLLAVIVGSGIMGDRLSAGDAAIALLANSLATGAGLYAIISTPQRVSGAHLNPLVTALDAWRGEVAWSLAFGYIAAQFLGAIVGVLVAHAMFAMPLLQTSVADRTGLALMFAEFIATAGLLAVIRLSSPLDVAAAVGTYITAAYWFTASTSFANPAVTVARAITASFSGISWVAVPGFVVAQLLATALVGAACMRTASTKRRRG